MAIYTHNCTDDRSGALGWLHRGSFIASSGEGRLRGQYQKAAPAVKSLAKGRAVPKLRKAIYE